MKVITEDNKDTSLLSKAYSYLYGEENVYYGQGTGFFGGGLRKFIENIIAESKEDEEIIVYIDVIYDNKYTIECFIKLYTYFKSKGYKNIYIVPIVCSEYCFLSAIESYSGEISDADAQILHGKVDYKMSGKYTAPTFEKAMKRLCGLNKWVVEKFKKEENKYWFYECILTHSAFLGTKELSKVYDLREISNLEVVSRFIKKLHTWKADTSKAEEMLSIVERRVY